MTKLQFTAIIEREGTGYVALCPELDVASQGDTIEQTRDNLSEAVGLFLECATESEVQTRGGGPLHARPLSRGAGFSGPRAAGREREAGLTCLGWK